MGSQVKETFHDSDLKIDTVSGAGSQGDTD
jgi:hypothetical protein